ncbi:hypothetical protein Shyd_56780 [Streptomyces hydrogenans]|uniref:Uncharacterized protein n=1 Tax=Streptomyces hydrogenans TaxID=1873719 RepID=A0ABQ3PH01_9ACTN|nr:hypothetical protein Shyd_56780 [Streptomyces hydrogenans]
MLLAGTEAARGRDRARLSVVSVSGWPRTRWRRARMVRAMAVVVVSPTGLGEVGGPAGQGTRPLGVAFVDVGPDGLADEICAVRFASSGCGVECGGEQFVRAVQVLAAGVDQGDEGVDALVGGGVVAHDEACGGPAAGRSP